MLLAQALAASEEEAVKASRRRVRFDWTHKLGPTLHLYNTGRGRGPTLHLYNTGRGKGPTVRCTTLEGEGAYSTLYNIGRGKGAYCTLYNTGRGGGLLYIVQHWKGEGPTLHLYTTGRGRGLLYIVQHWKGKGAYCTFIHHLKGGLLYIYTPLEGGRGPL